MKTIHWDIMLYSPIKFNQQFRQTHHLYRQGQDIGMQLAACFIPVYHLAKGCSS
jgi:hypothetical protein